MTKRAMEVMDEAGSRVAGDFRAKIADSEELMKAAATMSGEIFMAARAKFEGRLQNARASLAGLSQPIVDRTRQTARAVDGYVQTNPWTAVGVALAAGVAFGILAARR